MDSEAFCISAFDTAGGKTADKMFLDQYKQDDDRYGCKQRGCKQILPFYHVIAVKYCNTNSKWFEYIC